MGAKGKRTAIRTCAGCRQRDARDCLLRFARTVDTDRIAPDIRRRAPGRGVSVHPRKSCIVRAVKSGAFRRAFPATPGPAAGELVASAAEQYRLRIEQLLAIARRNRRLLCGAPTDPDLAERIICAAERAAAFEEDA